MRGNSIQKYPRKASKELAELRLGDLDHSSTPPGKVEGDGSVAESCRSQIKQHLEKVFGGRKGFRKG